MKDRIDPFRLFSLAGALGLALAVLVGLGLEAPVAAGPAAVTPIVVPLPASFGAIAVDPATGNALISSPKNNVITVVSPSGHVVKTIAGVAGAGAMVVVGTQLYVVSITTGDLLKIDLPSLTQVGPIVTGLTSAKDIAAAGGLLWVEVANGDLTSDDPDTGAVTASTVQAAGTLLADDPGNASMFFSGDTYSDPTTISSYVVSSGTVSRLTSVTFYGQGGEPQLDGFGDLAVSPDGAHFVPAAGGLYKFGSSGIDVGAVEEPVSREAL